MADYLLGHACTPTLTVVLYIKAKMQNQPSLDKWIKDMCTCIRCFIKP